MPRILSKTEKRIGRERERGGRRVRFAAALLLLVATCPAIPWGTGVGPAQAETESKDITDYLSGQVTGTHGGNIIINGQEYALDAEVTIVDDDGKPRELKDFEAGTPVRFHLKRGRIDVLVLILPK